MPAILAGSLLVICHFSVDIKPELCASLSSLPALPVATSAKLVPDAGRAERRCRAVGCREERTTVLRCGLAGDRICRWTRTHFPPHARKYLAAERCTATTID